MAVTIPTVLDEEILLGGQHVSAVGGASPAGLEDATLIGPSSHGSYTPSIKGGTNANGGSGVVKKIPLPWAQFSLVLFLEFAEPLTLEAISPVSPSFGLLRFLPFFLFLFFGVG